MKRFKKSALLLCSMMVLLLMSTSVFATDSWVEAKIMDSSIGVSKQTAEISSISYVADKNVGIEVNNDKFSISSGNFNFSSEVYVSNSVENEADLDNVTYHKVENGAKTGIVYFDSKKIDVRYVTSYFNVKVVTGDNTSVIKVKTTVNYGDLYVYAFQMNTNHDEGGVSEFNPSYRVVNYCGNVLANGNNLIPVKGFGTVYGIDGTFTKDDLVKNSSNNKVYSFDATEQGLVDVNGATQWDNYYALTFKNLSYNPELLDRNYTLRPYAILEDGSILYSDDVQTTSIYEVAQILYERNAMSTPEARQFLLDHILNIVKIKNSYVDTAKTMLTVLNVTDKNSIEYKFVNNLYKDLFYYVQLTHDYHVDHYVDRGPFVAKTFSEDKDPNTELLAKLNEATSTEYTSLADWIKFETPKYGVEGMYVPAGIYADNELVKEWNDLVKDGDITVENSTLKEVSDSVSGGLYIPETITKVESVKNENVSPVVVPDSVTEISEGAFKGTSTVISISDIEGAPWNADEAIICGNTIVNDNIYVAYNSTTKELAFSNNEADLSGYDTQYGNIKDSVYTSNLQRPWDTVAKEVKTVNIVSTIYPTNTAYWFYDVGYNNMTSLDLTNLNTSKVTNMSRMFKNCGYTAMTSLDLGNNFDTSNVTNMFSMFSYCGHKLMTSLDLGDNFDTSNVTNMVAMFSDCGKYKMGSLNLGNKFNTSNVTNMNYMFRYCWNLDSLNLGDKFDTSNVTSMSGMFQECGELAMISLNLGDKFDTSNVTSMSSMFANCGRCKMTLLNLGDKFDTSNVTNMSSMFANCGQYKMTSLNLGNKFDTSNVTNMRNMYKSCGYTTMTSLNLGDNFDTSNVTNMSAMFYECGYTAMTSLDLGDKFDTSNVTDMSQMFFNCGYTAMTSMDLGDKFDTSNVTSMYQMFVSCGRKVSTTIRLGKFAPNSTVKASTNKYTNIFDDMNSSDKLYMDSTDTQSWIAGLQSNDKPSDWKKDINLNIACGPNRLEHNFEKQLGNCTIKTKDVCSDCGYSIEYDYEHSYNSNNECTTCGKFNDNIYVAYDTATKELAFANNEASLSNYDTQYGNIKGFSYTTASGRPWNSVSKNVVTVDIKTPIYPTNTAWWFYNVGYNEMIELDLNNLHTENVTNMSRMFQYCGYTAMTSINLGDNFDTSNVTSMEYMFSSCGYARMTLLDLGDKFNTEKVTSMSGMFYNCGKFVLTTIYMGDWNPTSTIKSSTSKYSGIFSKMNTSAKLYFNNSEARDWVSSLDSTYRPSAWTTTNNILLTSQLTN